MTETPAPSPLSSAASSDARVVRTRAALRNALLALLEQKPFDQITIRDISAQAGTGYATFFRHYETKWGLLNDLAADEIKDLMQHSMPLLAGPNSGAPNTRAAAMMLCQYVDEHRALWSALLTGGAASPLREEFMRQAKSVATVSAPRGGWLPDDLRVIYGVSAAVEILTWWLQQPRDFPIAQVAEIIDRLVIAPTVID